MYCYKRNDTIIYKTEISEKNIFKGRLRQVQYSPRLRAWTSPVTYSVLIDLLIFFKDSIRMDDAETAEWVQSSQVVLRRLDELQKGTDRENIREVVLPDVIKYKKVPYQHQKEAIAFALNMKKCALWLDMGLGKTFTSITLARLRHAMPTLGGIKKVLVITPRSLMYQWDNEVRELADNAESIIIAGTPRQKEKALYKIPEDQLSFSMITYEGIFNLEEDLKLQQFDMFIMDEATKIKNPKAKRTLATAELCQTIPYGVELTGMAYVNNPLDLFAQFLALDTTVYGTNQWVFSERYINYGKAPFGRFIRGFKRMDELKQRAYFLAFSRTKEQCLDLPPRVYQTRTLPLYEAQATWYNDLLSQLNKEASEELLEAENGIQENSETSTSEPTVTVEYIIAMTQKLEQITAGYIRADNGEYIWLDSPKYEEMYSIISNSTDQFIVWAKHTYVLRKLYEYLNTKGIKVEVLDRRVSDARRQVVKEQFKKGKIRVLVLQLQSECRGNDFTCEVNSVSAIFFENTASIEERSQAEDRQHRIGMKGTAVYIDLICEDTYDEGIQLLLKNKKTLSQYIKEQDYKILLGRGGSVTVKKTRSKKRPKLPSDVDAELEAQNNIELADEIEGLEL